MKHLAVILTTCMIVLTSFVHVSNEENNTVSPRMAGTVNWRVNPTSVLTTIGDAFTLQVIIELPYNVCAQNCSVSVTIENEEFDLLNGPTLNNIIQTETRFSVTLAGKVLGPKNITIRIKGSYTENGMTIEYNETKTIPVNIVLPSQEIQ